MPRKIGPGWYGYLTRENAEEMAVYMLNLLKGRNYTWIDIQATDIPDYIGRVNVRPGERLKRRGGWRGGGYSGEHCPLIVEVGDNPDREWHGFTFATTYGIMSLHTNAKDQSDAWAKCNVKSRAVPYVKFDQTADTIVIHIEHRVPAGTLTQWILSIDSTDLNDDDY